MNSYIFGYGSLLNKQSLERALKRKLHPDEIHTVEISGFKRCWRAKENLYFEALDKEAIGIFLDIRPEVDSAVNGVLVEITITELEQLKKREKNYICADISSALTGVDLNGTAYTFVAKEDHYLQPGDNEAYVPQRYIDMVVDGAKDFGKDFLNRYYQGTDDADALPIAPGAYTFIDVEQKKFV